MTCRRPYEAGSAEYSLAAPVLREPARNAAAPARRRRRQLRRGGARPGDQPALRPDVGGRLAELVCETEPDLPQVGVAHTNNYSRGGSAGIFRGLGGYVPAERSRLGPIPLIKPPYTCLAIDLNEGEIAWSVRFGEGSRVMRAHPLLRGVDLPERLGTPGAPAPWSPAAGSYSSAAARGSS